MILETTYQSTFRKKAPTMTAPRVVDPARVASEQLEQASPDLMRQMLTTFINALMSVEADAVYGHHGVPPRNPRKIREVPSCKRRCGSRHLSG